jgi:hypothetical protein
MNADSIASYCKQAFNTTARRTPARPSCSFTMGKSFRFVIIGKRSGVRQFAVNCACCNFVALVNPLGDPSRQRPKGGRGVG